MQRLGDKSSTEITLEPVRWGVLSTARIAMKKVIPGMLKSRLLTLTGIASRDLAHAQAAVSEIGVGRPYGSYEDMLADPEIEVVYNPLPNHLHVPMTLAAVKAGKHVLCEKPMALDASELELLRPYADRFHIREAVMVRFHPQWIEAREQIRRGAIGEPRFMQVSFSYFNDNAADIRNRAEMGGGALYDVGCYAIIAGRWFFEANPQRVIATMDRDRVLGTDRCTSGLLDFAGGQQLAFSVSTQAARYQRICITGTRGRLEVEIPFSPPADAACLVRLDDGIGTRYITLPVADHYQLQAEDFSDAVRHHEPTTAALDDAQWNMRTIGALFASVRSGRFEAL
jgi:predicted dehydrogenase